jgi:hypothetical protein
MKKSRPIRLYAHHQHFQEINQEGLFSDAQQTKKTPDNLFFSILYGVGYVVFNVSFGIGFAIYSTAKFTVVVLPQQVLTKTKKLTLYDPRLKQAISVFVVLIMISTLGLRATALITNGLELKGKVLGSADSGITLLGQAGEALHNQNAQLAEKRFIEALGQFKTGKEQLNKTGVLLNTLLLAVPQKRDGEHLISAAESASKAGVLLANTYDTFSKLRFGPEGIVAVNGAPNLKTLLTNIREATTEISKAATEISKVNPNSIPDQQRLAFLQIQNNLDSLGNSLEIIADLNNLASQILLGQQEILVLLQNNNELRASGGFIGTYGQISLSNGKIVSMQIKSIYDLDGQLNERIVPPHPILAVNNRWFLRDSNWFIDFPTTAQKISSFYEKEGQETPDMVIALTPDIVTKLLKLTGPISVGSAGLTLNSENFVEQTQVSTSVEYDKTANNPKQLLADFVPLLLQNIMGLQEQQPQVLFEAIQQSLLSKQILLYSRNPETQKILESFNWTGSIKSTDRDFLNVVSTNLNGTKTDLFINQSLSLKAVIKDDGSIVNTLTITKSSSLPNNPKLTNKSFLRILVPQGSTLLSNTGFTQTEIGLPDRTGSKEDPDVLLWEKQSVKDLLTGTIIGQESGKTFFGNWLEVAGGETKTVTITYKLPFTLEKLDHYSLLIQKQPGSLNQELSYTLDFPNYFMAWKNFDPQVSNHSLTQKLIFNKDLFFALVLDKR